MPSEVTTESEAQPEVDAPEVLELLTARLRGGLNVSPLCLAVLGWLCDVNTDPYVVVIRLRGSQVLLRVSDEKITAPFGTLTEFLEQIALLCASLQFTEAQTQAVTDAATRRLVPSVPSQRVRN